MSDRKSNKSMGQSARESAQAMRDRDVAAMQPGDNKSTVHSLPPDERESMLSLDDEEHRTEGDGGGGRRHREQHEQEQATNTATGGRQMGGGVGGPLDSVADTVTKAFGGKGK